MSHLPALAIVIPLTTAFIGSLLELLNRRCGPYVVSAALLHGFVIVRLSIRVYTDGPIVYAVGGWFPPLGIVLVVDHIAMVFLLLIGLGHPLTILFKMGADGMQNSAEGKFYILISLFFGALSGIAVAGDLFNLFVFVELATVCTVGLIVQKRRPEGAAAGFAYIMIASLSGTLLLFGIMLVYTTTGVLSMALVAQQAAAMPPHLHALATACIVVSFGIKFGLVPLHIWQPRAYHAAGSTSAGVLSAFGMKLYLYALMRLLWIPLQTPALLPALFPLLLAMGMVNILTGHGMGMIESDLKRLLAFSSIAHAGYILIGIAAAGTASSQNLSGTLASSAPMAAALFHSVNHAFMKSALLWSGHTFICAARSSRIRDLYGCGRSTPAMLAAFLLAAAAIVGIPPTGGFASKWQLAAAQSSLTPLLVIAAGTAISLCYYIRLFEVLVGRGAAPSPEAAGKGPGPRFFRPLRLTSVVALLLAAAAAATGPAESWVMQALEQAAESLLHSDRYIHLVANGASR